MLRKLITIYFLFCVHFVMAFTFEGQAPIDPKLYDAPEISSCGKTYREISCELVLPDAGVDKDTGILVHLPGFSTYDCDPTPVQLEDWNNTKNVIIATIAYRNLSFRIPTDFGKLGIGDVLRGLGGVMDRYPQINNRRIYLFGGSGGGHLALQVYQVAPRIWAEVYVHSAITLISTQEDVVRGYGTRWNGNLGFPEHQGALDLEKWNRFQAERQLRSPQFLVLAGANETCPVWMFHGVADPLVPIINMNEYQQHIVATNWHFVRIEGGNHNYMGAAEDENTRTKATNKYVPDCFTRVKTEASNLIVDFTSRASYGGWLLRVKGSLKDVMVTVDQGSEAKENKSAN